MSDTQAEVELMHVTWEREMPEQEQEEQNARRWDLQQEYEQDKCNLFKLLTWAGLFSLSTAWFTASLYFVMSSQEGYHSDDYIGNNKFLLFTNLAASSVAAGATFCEAIHASEVSCASGGGDDESIQDDEPDASRVLAQL